MAATGATRKSGHLPSRRQVLTDLRRSEIIAAALKVFARKGFHLARTEDVAEQAHIAKGTLYLYFKSKDDIYEAALHHAMTQLNELVETRIQQAEDTRERIHAWIQARLEFWSSHGDLYHMILTVGREQKFRKNTSRLLRAGMEEFSGILRDGIEAGDLQDRDATAVAWLVMDAIRGTIERRILNVCNRDLHRDVNLIMEIVLHYFGAAVH